MYHTPRSRVGSRRSARKDEEPIEGQSSAQELPLLPPSKKKEVIEEHIKQNEEKSVRNTKIEGSVVKSEQPLVDFQTMPVKSHPVSRPKSKRSTSSSVLARQKKLELEAAEAKAKIQMELIDKRLAANLAEIDDECSVRSDYTNKEVEEWLERSHRELEAQPVHDQGQTTDVPCAPVKWDTGTKGTVQLLASALKDLTAASTSNNLNSNLLSRICTPKDLPLFCGDPMEWLHFKQAYEESTKVCNFKENENLWRLRKCLKGSAREAVSALLISATSPETIMSTLELQFGNPEVILSRILTDLKKLHPVSQEYHKDIVTFSIRVRNCVAAVKLIGEEYLNGISMTTCILSKLPPVLLSKWADYSYIFIKQGRRPTWFDISEFLNEEAKKVSSMALLITKNITDGYYNKKKYTEATTHTVVLNKSGENNVKCLYCRISKHKLHDCKKFRKALRKDRWSFVKRHRLCYKCIDATHNRETCPAAACDVENCGQAHHKLLHYSTRQTTNDDNQCVKEFTTVESSSLAAPPESVNHVKSSECKVLLKVVPVSLHGPNGIIKTNALLDDGSTVSLISASLASRAGLRGRRRETMHVRGAWDNSALVCDTDCINVCIANCNGDKFELSVRSLQNFSVPIQNYNLVNFNMYSHLSSIKNEFNYSTSAPEILIGQDNYNLMLPLEIKAGKCNEPCATRTPLGWCVHGRAPASVSKHACNSTLHVTEVLSGLAEPPLEDLHEMVRKSFSIEHMGISGTPRRNSNDLRALEHLEQTAKLIDSRWYVGLPWKDGSCRMPDSELTALSRLHNLEKKMSCNEQYALRYRERIKHLLNNNFAEEILDTTKTNKTWYLPHFGVDNPNKNKLRLVFDAAAKTQGLSLNDYLLTGPDLLMSLLGIMLRFREHDIAVVGDIKDMFLRVKILQNDQDALRFLWRDNPKEPIKTYKMTSLIFGANCAPFIAQFIKNKNAECYESSKPAAVQAIRDQHYMDDYIDS
ncbi:unnamed protein product [Arctia plantaginis]|uniref:Peptidase aspartic putative domain-containing protein n=1 Tax=Arctia plantaginis TaxID=874455 RepID=A0A8S0Z7B9_ARCPL|nr:unnamed protein product [Arctia plantaginis]